MARVAAVCAATVVLCGLLVVPALGSVPWSEGRGALARAAAAPPGPTTIRVFLAPRGGLPALERAVMAVSTPGNRRYRRFITPAEYRARYEPTIAATQKVEHALGGLGLTVLAVERHRRWILARGAPAAAAQAEQRPGALSSASVGVTVVASPGPESRRPLPPINALTLAGGFQVTRPCSGYFGQRPARFEADGKTPLPAFNGTRPSYGVCGYAPRQLRRAYEGSTKLTGKAITVAVVLPFTDGTIRADASRQATGHSDPALPARQFSEWRPSSYDLTTGAGCDPAAGYTIEQSLDVEAVHAMAPAATIRYYAAPRCDNASDPGTIAALDAVVDENRASIVTNSYGDLEQTFSSGARAGYEQAFLQAAMQGITVLFSTGDFGSLLVYPASDPWVTAVGGTTAAIDRRNHLAFQTGWESDTYTLAAGASAWQPAGASAGGGGGFSALFSRPGWQHSVVPGSSPRGRGMPDLALDGNPSTGMAVGMTQRFPDGVHFGELRVGGTSLATPLLAGIEALAVQSAKGRLGFIDPAIYREARRHAKTFTDIGARYSDLAAVKAVYTHPLDPSRGISYLLRTFGVSVGFGMRLTARSGWDPATGIGSPTQRYFTSQGR